MPSIKISELPILNQLSANNANTVFVAVDKTSNTTSQFQTNTLAAGLFANNVLNVGTQTPSAFPGLIAQFVGNTAPYSQVNFENANTEGSMDVVLTADIGDDANNYLDLGINNSVYTDPQFSATKAVDGYLIVHGSSASDYIGNLVLGTAQAETNVLFAVGGTTNLDVVAKMTKNGLEFDNGGYITFDDGSVQTVAAADPAIALSARANTITTQGVDATQNTRLNIANTRLDSVETINTNQNTSINIIQGVDLTQNTRLDSIETNNINQNTNISIIQGTNVTQNTRLNSIETVNIDQNTSINIIQGVDVTQNTRLNSIETINSDQNTSISIIQGVNSWQNTEITAVNNYAASGYAKANAALANATGTFAGDLTITGDLTVIDNTTTNTAVIIDRITFNNDALIRTLTGSGNEKDITILTGNELSDNESGQITLQTGTAPINATGGDISLIPGVGGLGRGTINLFANTVSNGTVTIQNSTFSANSALMSITASDNFATVAPSNTNYMLHVTGKANSVTRVVLDSFGANTYTLLSGRMGRGSASLPLATGNNDVLFRFAGNGYTGTQFPSSSPSKIDMVAGENFSNTNRGTRIEFWNTPNGSNTIQKIASFNADSVTFTGTVAPEKGFIYSPNIYPSVQTAITINFENDSVVRAQTSDGLVVTLSNFVVGKSVEAWITNSVAGGQIFTHGCSATNSTVNSTTYSIPGTSTIFVKYWCMDGTLANTFVAITHT